MHKRLKIESEVDNLRIVEKVIDELSAEINVSKDNYGKILVSTLEAVNNAIIHGNRSVKSKYVFIEFKCKKDQLIISIEDEGPGFHPGNLPDPTKPENLERLNGRGVFLMSRLADKIEFNDKGNKVTMTFKEYKS